MTLREKQSRFAYLAALLIQFAYAKGYEITLGDAYATSGHIDYSFHYRRLAIDINLFLDGAYLTETEDYEILGMFWESLDTSCTWGGRFNDGNHFSYGE
jgi:hypothetical protein